MNISFKELFEYCSEHFEKISYTKDNEVYKVEGISIIQPDDTYKNIKYISKHFTTKDRYRIHVLTSRYEYKTIETTNDHTCIRWVERYQTENVKASDLKVGDYVYTSKDEPVDYGFEITCNRFFGTVVQIENLGPWNDYVYDLEVEDESHVYYANDILVHNSQFINIAPIVDYHLKLNNIENGTITSLNQEQLDKMIDEVDSFIEDDINQYIRNLINTECYTTQGDNLHYSREYIALQGMFFKKKHYITHIVKKDDKKVDFFKYSGVSCKKAEIPVDMKFFLKTIFEDTCNNNWKEYDYRKYIDKVFDQFITKDYGQISIYKSYKTEKTAVGFMESVRGAGVHARGANIYNQLLDDLKISNKYEKINLGDQLRYCYINDTNPYGINVIAFKEYIPEEFRKIFTINYDLMFEKIFLSSLKGYMSIMNFNEYSPTNKSICDINDL